MSDDPRHRLGEHGEQLAADHLARLGYEIVERNHRTRYGELDLIALDRGTLVFCEVKTRRGGAAPFESLHARKRQQVRRMAAAYLAQANRCPSAHALRFDAVGITLDARGELIRLDHLEGAF